jgi:hypothetical protein
MAVWTDIMTAVGRQGKATAFRIATAQAEWRPQSVFEKTLTMLRI